MFGIMAWNPIPNDDMCVSDTKQSESGEDHVTWKWDKMKSIWYSLCLTHNNFLYVLYVLCHFKFWHVLVYDVTFSVLSIDNNSIDKWSQMWATNNNDK